MSQSGETADTLAVIELAKSQDAFIFGICSVVGSYIARVTHSGCYTHVGPQIGVDYNKAFTGQVSVLLMLALAIAKEKGTIENDRFYNILHGMADLHQLIEKVLYLNNEIERYA